MKGVFVIPRSRNGGETWATRRCAPARQTGRRYFRASQISQPRRELGHPSGLLRGYNVLIDHRWPTSRRRCETWESQQRPHAVRARTLGAGNNVFHKFPTNPTNHITSYIIVRITSYEQNVPAGTLVQIFVVFRTERFVSLHERDARAYAYRRAIAGSWDDTNAS